MGKLNWGPSQLDRCNGKFLKDPKELEQESIQAAIRLSLQEASKTDRSTDLPKRKFKAEEIEEDEKKRDIELYGPPTPPRRPRQVGAMKSSKEPPAKKVPTGSGTNNKPSGNGAAKHPHKAAAADDSKANRSGIFVPKAVIDKLPGDVWSAVADAVAYHKQHVAEQPVRDIVDVMMGYNGKKADKDNTLPAWPRTALNNFPASRGSRFTKAAPPPEDFRLGFDGATAAAAAAPPKPPNHTERMAVIRAELNDPASALSVAVREQSRFIGGEKPQWARGGSSAGGAQPGSEKAGAAQKKKGRRD